MKATEQRAKASAFRNLHQGPQILVLPNAWDALSARIFEQAGFSAIATTSGGIAAMLGYPDGQCIGCQQMLQIVERIAASVSVPVSADMEAGYGDTTEQVVETIREVLEAGAVGVNLEDGTGHAKKPLADLAYQVEVIKAVRAVAATTNVPFVLNARTDVYLHAAEDEASRFKEAVRRANAYREAGADCLFIIGVRDRKTIACLVREIHGPVNIMAGSSSPAIPELQQLGVARVTFGSGLMRAALPVVRQIAQELLKSGTYTSFAQTEFTHAAVNQLFER
jgi:2-methylisocitrate lyase-like PEP mutase family enzyme